jgi:hypothetical protein
MKFAPPIAFGDLKTFLPESKKSPANAGGEMLRILKIKNGDKESVCKNSYLISFLSFFLLLVPFAAQILQAALKTEFAGIAAQSYRSSKVLSALNAAIHCPTADVFALYAARKRSILSLIR